MSQKIVFLDFDGVLNTEKYQAYLRKQNKPQWDEYGQIFDPVAVSNLKRIVDAVPNISIIVSSSWKLEGLDKMKEMWITRGLPGIIKGITPDFAPDLSAIDLYNTGNIPMLAGKGSEIMQWLKENAPEGCTYIIFDDCPDFLPEQEPFLICTDPKVGITTQDALRAIEILIGPSSSTTCPPPSTLSTR